VRLGQVRPAFLFRLDEHFSWSHVLVFHLRLYLDNARVCTYSYARMRECVSTDELN